MHDERSLNRNEDSVKRLPQALLEFIHLFNARRFWESHEVLEQPWRRNKSDFYQGLIIFASGYVHAQRGNPVGVRKQMAKVFGKLEKYRPHYMGIDVEAVLRWAADSIDFVERHRQLRGPELTEAIPYPLLRPEVALVRGDEPELHEPSDR